MNKENIWKFFWIQWAFRNEEHEGKYNTLFKSNININLFINYKTGNAFKSKINIEIIFSVEWTFYFNCKYMCVQSGDHIEVAES